MHEDYKPRFVFEISEEQRKRSDRVFNTYGLRKAIFSPILDDVLDLIEEGGGVAIGLLMQGRVSPRESLTGLKEISKEIKKYGNSK